MPSFLSQEHMDAPVAIAHTHLRDRHDPLPESRLRRAAGPIEIARLVKPQNVARPTDRNLIDALQLVDQASPIPRLKSCFRVRPAEWPYRETGQQSIVSANCSHPEAVSNVESRRPSASALPAPTAISLLKNTTLVAHRFNAQSIVDRIQDQGDLLLAELRDFHDQPLPSWPGRL